MNVNTKSLDGFRFLLALWVCVGHFYIVIGGSNFISIPIVSKILSTPVNAVDGFMIVTGFLMTYHYFLRQPKEPVNQFSTGVKFVTRRLFRLYPVYLIAILVAFFLVSDMYIIRKEALEFFTGSSLTIWGTESKLENSTIIGLLTHLLFIHGLVPGEDSSILSVAWSLSLEMQFYVLFPLIFVFLFRNINFTKTMLVTILSVIVSFITLRYYNLFFAMPAILILKFPLFLLGMFMAAAGLGKLNWRKFVILSLIVLASQSILTILIACILIFFLFLDNLKNYVNIRLFNVLSAVRDLLSSNVAKFGADISYSLYLLHMITLPFILNFYMGLNLSKYQAAAFSFATFIVLNFLLSYVLHLIIEKPFIRLGKVMVAKIESRELKRKSKKGSFDKVS
ncbi:acyltransferase family protein [Priestia aryabhattai]|uniref:acyltransferase family protein n=1 Tax=Priestia aryabhattai TaxID=412384 RepID=UPI001C8EF748|nr:acyltransferase [Priestia aryabhattai]MBX9988613.1 acyltransferase [Priestia aryabhattai]